MAAIIRAEHLSHIYGQGMPDASVAIQDINLSIEEGDFVGLIVNLADYTVGADKGGAVNMFDDFDIDYNQQKYLIETRCSGALTVPFSAISVEYKVGS